MRLLHSVAFSKKLRWLTQTKLVILKDAHLFPLCYKQSSSTAKIGKQSLLRFSPRDSCLLKIEFSILFKYLASMMIILDYFLFKCTHALQ